MTKKISNKKILDIKAIKNSYNEYRVYDENRYQSKTIDKEIDSVYMNIVFDESNPCFEDMTKSERMAALGLVKGMFLILKENPYTFLDKSMKRKEKNIAINALSVAGTAKAVYASLHEHNFSKKIEKFLEYVMIKSLELMFDSAKQMKREDKKSKMSPIKTLEFLKNWKYSFKELLNELGDKTHAYVEEFYADLLKNAEEIRENSILLNAFDEDFYINNIYIARYIDHAFVDYELNDVLYEHLFNILIEFCQIGVKFKLSKISLKGFFNNVTVEEEYEDYDDDDDDDYEDDENEAGEGCCCGGEEEKGECLCDEFKKKHDERMEELNKATDSLKEDENEVKEDYDEKILREEYERGAEEENR